MKTREIIQREFDKIGRFKSNAGFFRFLMGEYGGSFNTYKKQFYKLQREHEHKALYKDAQQKGYDADAVTHYWHKGKSISAFVKQQSPSYFDVRDEIVESMKEHAPQYERIDYGELDDPHLLVIDPADVHIGKLAREIESGSDYDMQIAQQRVIEGVAGILAKSQGFNIEQILFVGGNDILHTDNTTRGTTRGTPQDTDGMWYEHFEVAKNVYVSVIEYLRQIAPVHFVFNPSNHDYMSGYFLADVIKTWFRNSEVTFDCSISNRKYYRYFENLIGTTHGDTARIEKLPLLMANEACEDWAVTRFRYLYTHHVHHKTSSKDYTGVTIESMRSPSATDSWHAKNGYIAPMAIEGFVHGRQNGQVARITHYFK